DHDNGSEESFLVEIGESLLVGRWRGYLDRVRHPPAGDDVPVPNERERAVSPPNQLAGRDRPVPSAAELALDRGRVVAGVGPTRDRRRVVEPDAQPIAGELEMPHLLARAVDRAGPGTATVEIANLDPIGGKCDPAAVVGQRESGPERNAEQPLRVRGR